MWLASFCSTRANGRLHQARQRPAAPACERVREAGHRAGHADGVVRVERLAVDHLAAGVQEHVAVRSSRRRFAEVQRDALPGFRLVHHHEAATAEIAGVGQGHGQCKADGHGCIDGIAARLQHLDANP